LGEQLLGKKASLQHGEWLPWVATFERLSESSVKRYMTLGANRSRVSDLIAQDPELSIRKTLALLSDDSEPTPPANPLAPTSKVATVFQRVLNFADDDKLEASEEAELLNYWEQLSQKLKRRGLLTDDFRVGQQLAAYWTSRPRNPDKPLETVALG